MAAESVFLLKLGGWVASTAVDFIAGKVQLYISDQFQFQSTVKRQLKCLEEDLKKIQAVLDEADKRRIENPRLGAWLQDIKDATYDAEDVVDMFEYKIIQEEVEGKADDANNIFKRCFTFADSTVKKFIVSGDDLKKLNEVVDKFKRIAGDSSVMIQLIGRQPAVSQWISEIMELRATTSTPIKSVGRVEERDQLMELLDQFSGDDGGGSSSSRNFHVVPVVGIGGVGKTTLVQDVYNNQDVKFDLKAWVCVSDTFDVKRIAKEIIESASISRPHDFYQLQTLESIQQILQSGLSGKKFLIVLDDVWNVVEAKWEQLHSFLNCGKKGSRVVVTTRLPEIADMMRTKEAIHLEGLAEEAFQCFFASCAFGDKDPASYPNLKSVGDKIAGKLRGNPLAAKTVGAMLKVNLNGQYWEEVLHNQLWQTNQKKDGIMQALRLSYEYLPSYLKQCFVYCSLFPKDCRYSKKYLVRMWIAHGFILPSDQPILEEIGEAYFNELVSRSFIHKDFGDSVIHEDFGHYVIHDLLHDLALSLSDGEICIAENDEVYISPKVRHISICANNLALLCNGKFAKENVRSLVVFDCSVETLDTLMGLKGLRVLVLDKFRAELSLEFIKKMLHLRYLDIGLPPNDSSYEIPESVCKLYHLQVLGVGLSFDDCILWPNEINRMRLRHLEANTERLPWIGSLTLLQELNFRVNQGAKGFDIGQIRDISELRTLCLKGLETVKRKEQASQAMLGNKRYLKNLKLVWKQDTEEQQQVLEEDHQKEEDTLESLQPHRNLEKLKINGYGGGTPSWWNENWPSNLNTLHLCNCSKWEILPPLGHLPFLYKLKLVRMHAVRSIGSEFYASNGVRFSSKTIFPSLKVLHINEMPELKDCYKIEEEEEGFVLFPRLEHFSIRRCPKLTGSIILPFSPSVFNRISVEISEDVSLSVDVYKGYTEIKCTSTLVLTEWLPYHNLACIEHLTIIALSFPRELESLNLIQHLTSLRSLCFLNCNDLESLPEEYLLASLEELHLVICHKLRSLPSNLSNSLSNLQKLVIAHCYSITSLPEDGLPTSLIELQVLDNSSLAKRCLNEDWQKVAHIPTFIVNGIVVTEDNRKSVSDDLFAPSGEVPDSLLRDYFHILVAVKGRK